jgi:DNA-binding response OmpR family regulator
MTSTKARVLVIDDDPHIRTLVTRLLTHEGYEAVNAGSAEEGQAILASDPPDLVLLDVMMPRTDGIDLLTEIRTKSTIPVIMLTGLGEEADRILGLRSGADDYVVKPFSSGELTARIESVLRRSQPAASVDVLRFGDPNDGGLEINCTTRDVNVRGEPIALTAKEFDLLMFLARSPRQVFDRDQLLKQVWASSTDWQDPATVTEHVRRIRRKIEVDPERPRWLSTVRGVGYRFEP